MARREKRLIPLLEEYPLVQSVEAVTSNLFILDGADTMILVGGERPESVSQEQLLAATEEDELDRYLVVLEDLILDLGSSPASVYRGGHSIDDPSSIADHIFSILNGDILPEELRLETSDIVGQLQEAGLLSFQTPSSAAELLIHWTMVNDPRTIMNAGHGTGQFLDKIQERLSHDDGSKQTALYGIDTSEIACEIARTRLGGQATILQADFLQYRGDDEHPTLDDFLTQSDEPQQNGVTSNVKQARVSDDTNFDAIISHPPVVPVNRLPDSVKKSIRDEFECRRLDQAFVLHSLELLRSGGHGAFLIPQSSLTDSFTEALLSQGRIHCLARLANAEFLVRGIEPVLVFVQKSPSKSRPDESIRLLRIDDPEISSQHIDLFHGPADQAVERADNLDGVEMAHVAREAFDADLLSLALSAPKSSPFLYSEEFSELSDVAYPRTGLRTGDNSFFYFNLEKKDEWNIPDEFFVPVLRKLSPQSLRVTDSDITHYLLNLRHLVDEATRDLPSDVSLGEFIDWLKKNEQSQLAKYIAESQSLPERFGRNGLEALIPDDFTDRVWNPDLVARGIFAQPEWWIVDIEGDVVFDNTMVGIEPRNEVPRKALWALLNTPLYRRLQTESMPPLRTDANYSQLRIGELSRLPVIQSCLNEEFADEVEALLPAETAHAEIAIQNQIIESCTPAERGPVDAAYEGFSQAALSWFMSGEQLREFGRRIEEDEEPEEFLIGQFGENVLDHLERMYSSVPLFEGRREVLADLIELLNREHYQTFLVGLAPQFEGVLVDYLEATGGKVDTETKEIEQNGETNEYEIFVYYRSEGQRSKKKDLNNLLNEFFEGEYLRYLQETVRKRRNEIAHGNVIGEPRRNAVLLFVAFFGMTNNILHSYNRYLARSGR